MRNGAPVQHEAREADPKEAHPDRKERTPEEENHDLKSKHEVLLKEESKLRQMLAAVTSERDELRKKFDDISQRLNAEKRSQDQVQQADMKACTEQDDNHEMQQDRGVPKRKARASANPSPDLVSSTSSATSSTEETEQYPFVEEEYNSLRKRYLEPRIESKCELRSGRTIHKDSFKAAIDCDTPSHRAFKKEIQRLEKSKAKKDVKDKKIFVLLKRLALYEINPSRGFP